MREYIIGLEHPESIEIPRQHNAVSRNHAKITIDDTGTWILEDLRSTNGTFVVLPDGSLRRISRECITPATPIQLGPPTINGFRFTASYVEGDLDEGWKALQMGLYNIKEDEKRLKNHTKAFGWLHKLSSIIGLLLAYGIIFIVKMDDQTSMIMRMGFMAAAPAITGIISDNVSRGKRENLMKRRSSLRCPNPKCRRPLSESDIEYGACPYCKCYRRI